MTEESMKTLSRGMQVLLLLSTLGLTAGGYTALTVTDTLLVYDDDLNVTWLRDAGSRGEMTYAEAEAFIQELNNGAFAGGSNWRLPSADEMGAGCTYPQGEGFDCLGSELAHMYYVELGNTAGALPGLTNRGPFVDLERAYYWTETPVPSAPAMVFVFFMVNGYQTWGSKASHMYAWPVHDGRLTMPAAACNDDTDNDGDGATDYPHDAGCRGPDDTSETNEPICAMARRVLTGEVPQSLQLDFISATSPTCRITSLTPNLGAGYTLTRGPGALTCVPNSHTWANNGTSSPTITFNPSLAPGGGYGECVTDNVGLYWTTAQTAATPYTCPAANGTASAPFTINRTYVTYKTFYISEAVLGSCPNDLCPAIDGVQTADADGDAFGDPCDTCPAIANADQVDSDNDGDGNACDNCPTVANADQVDTDGDGVGDGCDNCPNTANANQADADGDGIGDACETTQTARYCSPLLPKTQYMTVYRAILDAQPRKSSETFAVNEAAIAAIKLGLMNWLACNRVDWRRDIGERFFCLTGPITTGIPQRCPGLPCEIDGPGCMNPEQRVRAWVPDSAVYSLAMWATGVIDERTLTTRLDSMVKLGQVKLDLGPSRPLRSRRFSPLQMAIGAAVVVAALIIGMLWGRRMRPSAGDA
jgi:hypothetical protein